VAIVLIFQILWNTETDFCGSVQDWGIFPQVRNQISILSTKQFGPCPFLLASWIHASTWRAHKDLPIPKLLLPIIALIISKLISYLTCATKPLCGTTLTSTSFFLLCERRPLNSAVMPWSPSGLYVECDFPESLCVFKVIFYACCHQKDSGLASLKDDSSMISFWN